MHIYYNYKMSSDVAEKAIQIVIGFLTNLWSGLQEGRLASYSILVGFIGVLWLLLLGKKKSAGAKWTSKYVINELCLKKGETLKGKTAIVTGGNTGLGLETCKALAYAGCRVIMCSRKVDAGEKAIKSEIIIDGESGYSVKDTSNIKVAELDLNSLSSIKQCADGILNSEKRIDYLICNAGVMLIPKKELTEDGFERNIGVNHFGHAYLIDLLLPKMKPQEHESRIVILASSAHTMGDIDVEDLDYNKRKYSKWGAYGSSKLANILYAKALSDRLKDTANKIIVCSLHPGAIATDLWRRMNKIILFFVSPFVMDKTVAQGAATTLFACLHKDGNELRGQYLLDCAVGLPNSKGQDKSSVARNALYEVTRKVLDEKVKKLVK